MDEDENLSLLLSMGFPDIEEAQRALRAAKNDLNEAVRPTHSLGNVRRGVNNIIMHFLQSLLL